MTFRLFNDPDIQARFDRDGYVVMDFIRPEEARFIAEKFYALHSELPQGFYSAAFSSDDVFKQEIYTHTQQVFDRVVNEKFRDFKILGSTFLCKAPGPEGKVGVHQDWTVVDESRYCSVTIWVPTVDTDECNGALRVLPGSHLFFDAYRSNHIPVGYKGSEEILWESMITVPMKAGQAFVLNHAVIHASAPNLSERERLVIAYGLAPREAPLMYYFKEEGAEDDRIEKFAMPDDFFQRYYNIGRRPLFGEKVAEFDYPVTPLGTDEMKKMIDQARTERGLPALYANESQEPGNPAGWMNKLKKWALGT